MLLFTLRIHPVQHFKASMKVSIITVVYNNERTIADAIESVLAQTYPDIEHIIVDGKSKDNTLAVINRYQDKLGKIISEKDKGLYDAMNKGIKAATGDIVGILNSDDFLYDNDVIANIVASFDAGTDATVANVVFVDQEELKIRRFYSAKRWKPSKFAWGQAPPHPSFFARRKLFEQYGYYETDYEIAADFELMVRFLLLHKVNWKYLPLITTKMRLGGKSTKNFKSLVINNREKLRACKANKVSSNYLMQFAKYLSKPIELLFPNRKP